MGSLVAILQNDPNLLRCQVRRLEGHVALREPERAPDAYGFGYFKGSDVLVGKRPSGAPAPLSLLQLAGSVDSHALLAHARYATVGIQKDENTHPFRYRRWLFAHDGTVEAFAQVKPRLLSELPDFLRRHVEGETDSEHAFMLFLKHLRALARLDDHDLEARDVGRALAQTVRDLEGWSREAGASRPGGLNFATTNGRVLAATRRGRPLYYALLEGIMPCGHHGIDATTPESDPRVRPHRQLKAVCIASCLRQRNGFIEVPDASVVSVSRSLQVTVSGLARPRGRRAPGPGGRSSLEHRHQTIDQGRGTTMDLQVSIAKRSVMPETKSVTARAAVSEGRGSTPNRSRRRSASPASQA